MEKNAVTTREFDQGNCQIHYQILPQYLHVGRNFGSVRIRSLRQEFVFPVEVIKKNVQGADGREKKQQIRHLSVNFPSAPETGIYR